MASSIADQAQHHESTTVRVGLAADAGGADLPTLRRIVQAWPGWLMLVARDRRVLARSDTLARALGPLPLAIEPPHCTQFVHTDGPGHCCLDFCDIGAGAQASVLVQTPAGHGSTRALSARLEPIQLTDGGAAWLVHLDPYDEALREDAATAWREVVAMLRTAGEDEAEWLPQLTQRWVQPLVRPRWTGWMRESPGGGTQCRAASGRLDSGLTQAALCRAIVAGRASAGHSLPLTLPPVTGGKLLHLIPSGPSPGWVLALLGGHMDSARAAMLHGLVVAVAIAPAQPASPDELEGDARAASALPGLTERESEIVHLVAQGLADKRIAQRLGLSFHTVRNYLRHIMCKLGVNKRAQIAFAVAAGRGPRPW
jgi:DNA-binding CsgD family transcriptional regulator